MKTKMILALLAAVTLLFSFGCGKNADSGSAPAENATQAAVDAEGDKVDAMLDAYRPPAELFELDLSQSDPSDENVQFDYDELGRVDSCTYMIDGSKIIVAYSYTDGFMNVTAFMDSYVMADADIELPGEYDPDAGFSVLSGYFVKGYQNG